METEVKVLDIDSDAVIDTLTTLGAQRVFDGVLRAVFFDRGTVLRDEEKTLRVRTDEERSIIAVKVRHASSEHKVSEEYEFSGSFDDALAALRALGFEPYARSEKHRTSYALDDVRIDIDRYLDDSSVPPFLEVEGPAEAIEPTIRALGLTGHRRVSWSGQTLREHYARR
jgi:adenylate cyclase, class 2